MTSLLDTARRLVQLGKVATPGPWTAGRDGVYGDDGTYLADTGHADGLDEAKVNTAFIAAARSSDQIAAKLVEAEALIRELFHRGHADVDNRARAFLSSLTQDAAQPAPDGEAT